MADVKISIVTVCFNSVTTIEQTIKSVIDQSYKNIEYIIIDGGSTDGTLDIIKKYEPYISYWVSEPDKGVYDAMNKGIKVATGELIAFINSDDWYDKDAMYHFAEAYTEEPADVLFGDIVYVEEDGSTQYENNESVDLKKMLYTNKLCHQAICVNTQLMKDSLFDLQYRIASDYDFLLKIYIEGMTFRYVGNHVVANFRKVGLSTINAFATANEAYKIACTRTLAKLLADNNIKEYSRMEALLERRRYYRMLPQIFADIMQENKNIVDTDNGLKNKYVIFGVGEVGKKLLHVFNFLGVSVEGFVDSSTSLWGKHYDGKSIFSPEELKNKTDVKVVISSYEYSEEMATTLENFGLRENEDFFKFETWVIWLLKAMNYNI